MNATSSDASWPSAEEDPVTLYALEVTSGQKPAGTWVRKACERHLRDLAVAEAGGKWQWRPALALRAIGLCRLFRHYKGELGGKPLVLERWQAFILGSLMGWVHRETGLRRFRNGFVELPRGQGKSTLAAAILLIYTFFDGENGADGYCFATKKDQASIVFRTARQMILRSKAVRDFVQVLKYNLHDDSTESKAEALGADASTLDGLRPHVAIGDEVHKHASPDLVEVIESGMGTRQQPLLFLITTAGESDGVETVYGQHFSISTQVLDGVVDMPEYFAYVSCADAADDWSDEGTWIKANPNWGVSVKPDFLRTEFRKALANPAEQPKFRRLYLGQKVQATDAYFSLADWDACPELPSDEELAKCPMWIGLDLSSSVDVTAAVQIWRIDADEIAVRPWFWLPEDGLEERRRRDKVPYPLWVEQGHIATTPGNTIDRAVVRRAIVELAGAWKGATAKAGFQSIPYDPWHAPEMMQAVQDEDRVLCVSVAQRFQFLSQPTKDLQALILRRRVRHDHSPVMRQHVSNMKVKMDDKENVMPCKRRSRGRIDGAQALITGLTQALIQVTKRQSSYATGGGYIIRADGAYDARTGERVS